MSDKPSDTPKVISNKARETKKNRRKMARRSRTINQQKKKK